VNFLPGETDGHSFRTRSVAYNSTCDRDLQAGSKAGKVASHLRIEEGGSYPWVRPMLRFALGNTGPPELVPALEE
jgi:hypothetical protein